MKTSELTRAALNWAAAKCEFPEALTEDIEVWVQPLPCDDPSDFKFQPSTDWMQGGPIIERENISITSTDFAWWECEEGWYAHIGDCYAHGPTPLIAAMRCYVASKLGEEVEIPTELTQGE